MALAALCVRKLARLALSVTLSLLGLAIFITGKSGRLRIVKDLTLPPGTGARSISLPRGSGL